MVSISKTSLVTLTLIAATQATLPYCGYSHHYWTADMKYVLVDCDFTQWEDANAYCYYYFGTSLATDLGPMDSSRLGYLCDKNTVDTHCFIGFNNRANGGSLPFRWVEDNSITGSNGYTNFIPGEPHLLDDGNAECGGILTYTNGGWADGQCYFPSGCPAICNGPIRDECGFELCANAPCHCNEVQNCAVCGGHTNGCDQCKPGYWKKDYDYHCQSCSASFGPGCLHCTDFTGCQECADGYWRVWDSDCKVWKCITQNDECVDYTDMDSCNADVSCKWVIDGANSYCTCDADGEQDIAILMDISGSVSDTEYTQSVDFVKQLIQSGKTPSSRISIIQFDETQYSRHSLTDAQDISDLLDNNIYIRQDDDGWTDIDGAVIAAINEIKTNGNANDKLIILITDGDDTWPRPESSVVPPCDGGAVEAFLTSELENNDIILTIIQIGSLSVSEVECLTTANSEPALQGDICQIDGFDDFDDIIGFISEFLCIEGPRLGCPLECSEDPCPCNEAEHCHKCAPNEGCDQCEDGYFKKDYHFQCVQCQEQFGNECLHCTDFLGCQQCRDGYTLKYDSECGLHHCVASSPVPIPTPGLCPINIEACESNKCSGDGDNPHCSNQQSWGCDSCNDGFWMKSHDFPCVSCSMIYGCNECNDWQGCTSCAAGYTLEWNHDCGFGICVY